MSACQQLVPVTHYGGRYQSGTMEACGDERGTSVGVVG
jgi:hypothetical protein